MKKPATRDTLLLLLSSISAVSNTFIAVGVALVIVGFVFRFGRGFGEFFSVAIRDEDLLELRQLELLFGLFVAAGLALLLLLPLAAFGIFKQHRRLLKLYAALLIATVVIQLAVGILSFSYSDQINRLTSDESLYESLIRALRERKEAGGKRPEDGEESNFWRTTQDIMECCGVTKSMDWLGFSASELEDYKCIRINYDKGCDKEIRRRLSSDAQYIAAASLGILLLEFVTAFLFWWRSSDIPQA